MAFSFIYVGKETGRSYVNYNVDFAVGQGGRNLKDDAMLVQVLLNMLYFEHGGLGAGQIGGNDLPFPPREDMEMLAVDGIIGPKTNRAIGHFKRQCIEMGAKVHPDAVMDPMFEDPNARTIRTRSRFALSLLNNVNRNYEINHDLHKFDNLANDPDIPPLLRSALLYNKRTKALQYTGSSGSFGGWP